MVTSSKDTRSLDVKVSLAEASVFNCQCDNALSWTVFYSTVGGEDVLKTWETLSQFSIVLRLWRGHCTSLGTSVAHLLKQG